MMDSKMVVVSTTNKMFNTSLYDSLTPKSLVRTPLARARCQIVHVFISSVPLLFRIKTSNAELFAVKCTRDHAVMMFYCNSLRPLQVSWQRVRVANALATSGPEWVSYLDYYNSGTYNNQ